jgi:uridine kinase
MPPPHYTIGIAGGSASGKSTFADALSNAIALVRPEWASTILHADRYADQNRDIAPTFVSPSTGETRFNWNHPDAIDADRLASDMTGWRNAQSTPSILIVEGLMVLQSPILRPLLDLRLFIELDADLRALRRLLRDMQGGRASRDPQFIATYYRESARVGHQLYVEPSRQQADLIVRGDSDFERTSALVASIAISALTST